MSNINTHVYEGLFLLPQSAGTDLGGSAELVKSLLTKVGAEIISFKKWDERRLAYEIRGNKRGLYFLCYFRLAGSEVTALDRQCLLSEGIIRHMFTRTDHLTMEQMQAADGEQALSDEIKLRAEQADDRAAATTSIGDRADATAEKAEAAPAEEPAEETGTDETPAEEAVSTEAGTGGESA